MSDNMDASEEQSTSASSKRKKRAATTTAEITVKQEASAVEEVEMVERTTTTGEQRTEEANGAENGHGHGQMVAAAPEQQQGNGGQQEMEEEGEEHREGPRINTFLVMSEDNCVHEAVFPLGREYTQLVTTAGGPAKKFEFRLDRFQEEAIRCLDNNRSVLVSAHTSTGFKTVVSIYAIALARRDKQRAIYTLPIKELCNQKYGELAEEFEDVGLVTGDVSLNPNACCVVMTTESLRSKLYQEGSEVLRKVGWVIFDEIQYARDNNAERDVVWEETIILLPPATRKVFLSAAVPNAKQFAQWICYLYDQPCHVVYSDQRPLPLQHLVFPAGSDRLFEVVDPDQDTFNEDNFLNAMQCLQSDAQPAPAVDNVGQANRRPIGGGGGDSTNMSVVKIIRTITERGMLPCVVFSHSRKECELYAADVNQMDFNSEVEKRAVRLIFENAIDSLVEDDKKLPHIRNCLPYLLRGIGIHHSGQLPIMREIVEILFGQGLIKTLFATKTFAMAVNMPAKTVLITSARKFDGTAHRWINSGEYIQMSDRAGRKYKDDRGLVILMMEQQMDADQAMQLIQGPSDPLNSQFRLSYNMVLNLLRKPEIDLKLVLEKSFLQWQNYTQLPELMTAAREKKRAMSNMRVEKETELKYLYDKQEQVDQLRQRIKENVMLPVKVVPFFHPGRMLKMKHFDKDYDWGVLVNWRKTPNPLDPTSAEIIYIVEVAVLISRESERHLPDLSMVRPPGDRERGAIGILPFTFDCIQAVSTVRLKLPQELHTKEALETVALTLAATKKRYDDDIPELHPIEHMHIAEPTVARQLTELKDLGQQLASHPLRKRLDFADLYAAFLNKRKLEEEYERARKRETDGKKVLQEEELQCRKRVLRRLGYATDDDVITVKGRVACELMSSAVDQELVLAEMLYTGAFSQLQAEETAALLSCFVLEERAPPTAQLPENLKKHLNIMQVQARRVAKVANECKLALDEEQYLEGFNAGMMDLVYQWCRGATFAAIMDSTQLFEGTIVRCMRRLDQLLREMVTAAKAMQEGAMVNKFKQARTLLKRDIAFSASLYL